MANEIGDIQATPRKMDIEGANTKGKTTIDAEETIYSTTNQGEIELEEGNMTENKTILYEETIENTASPVFMEQNGVAMEEKDAKSEDAKSEIERRDPIIIMGGPNNKVTIQSRYLSASLGSCHDLCKYGHRHEPRRSIVKTIDERRSLMRTISEGKDFIEPVVVKRNKSFIRRLSLPPVKQLPLVAEKMSPSSKDSSKAKLKRVQSDLKSSSIQNVVYSASKSKSDFRIVANSMENASQNIKAIKVTKETGSSKLESISPSTPSKKLPGMRKRLYKNLKNLSCSKDQNNLQKVGTNKSGEVPKKMLYVVEPKFDKKTSEAAQSAVPMENTPNSPRRSHVSKAKGSAGKQKGFRVGYSPSSEPSSSKPTPQKALKRFQPRGEEKGDVVSLRTKRTGNISEDIVSNTSNPKSKSNTERKTKAKRAGVTRSEDKDSPAWKLKFRRGTVVSPKVSNSAPKRLQFKKGKMLGDTQNVKNDATDKTCLNSNEVASSESSDSKGTSEKVILRHQEAAGKKEDVDLNNVIEETASKLVKTRKSKVKALVGAFETVMSFHDRKPLVEAGAS